jgi:hypothetical protein
MKELGGFEEIWAADFEFHAPPGERPQPICLVARECRSGRLIRQWFDEFGSAPPFRTDSGALFVAYYASAELGCFKALGWALPANVLDLFAEFRVARNGLEAPGDKRGLLAALVHYGLSSIAATEKEMGRDLAIRGGPYTGDEKGYLLDYCQSDVDALFRLLPLMAPDIDVPRAVHRGRYMVAAAAIEWNGIPIDRPALDRLRKGWDGIKDALIAEIDVEYGVYEGTTFRLNRFEQYLAREGIPWPRLESGQLDLEDGTFREMARSEPRIAPLRELRASLSKLRLNDLAVGKDGRNRAILSAFQSRTGRNQPSNAKSIFGPSVWLRHLIKPEPGRAVAYIDWAAQELAIAAVLSGDQNMIAAYTSGDPYLWFAKLAGAVPADATKQSHETVRDVFKTCMLGVNYAMGAWTLAGRTGLSIVEANELLLKHRMTFPRFWKWSEGCVDHAMLTLSTRTLFGWRQQIAVDQNPRSLRNFPMQANGAEMMRIAAILATEAGIQVCAPVHDAFLIESSVEDIDADVVRMQSIMAEASRLVLGDFPMRTDAKVVRYPDRFTDKRGIVMWDRVCGLLYMETLNAGRSARRLQEKDSEKAILCR